ncbi:putative transporter [Colletotrichum tanaceti]|uniref:Putative transporter n=1 Tax=Colletotrichum tanaceti TaxID=1306861 RepID=A0A4V6DG42_9PEZI|nr:putative transporter [Colletotrichum tanaceti]
MALYVAIVYGILHLLITTFSFVYKDQYGFDEGTVDLTFLPAARSSRCPCAVVLPVGLFTYGWSAEKGVRFIAPMLGVVVFSIGLMGVMVTCIQNYLLDSYPLYAASVTAALAVLRSLSGALLPLGGLEMYNALGLGWGNSLLAFISVGLIPIPLVFYMFGARIRSRTNAKL